MQKTNNKINTKNNNSSYKDWIFGKLLKSAGKNINAIETSSGMVDKNIQGKEVLNYQIEIKEEIETKDELL